MKKATLVILCIFLINLLVFPMSFVNAASYNPNIELTSQSVYLLNKESNLVVYENASDKRYDPTSLTHIMTAIIALENVKDIENEKATAKAWIYDDLFGNNYPTADVKRGEIISIKDLLYCMLLQSSYEAAAVIADYVSDGSYVYFAELMNKKAAQLGCENTNFVNPHGAINEKQYTTAKDMAKIGMYAMNNPIFAEIVLNSRYTVPPNNLHPEERILVNSNKMIDSSSSSYYKPCFGVKTGGLVSSGRNAVFAATNEGLTYFCVLMGSPALDENGEYISKNGTITDGLKLFKWSFSSFSVKNLLETDASCGQVKLKLSTEKDYLLLYPKEKFISLVANDVDKTSVLVKRYIPESVSAPIEIGQEIGHIELILSGEVIATIPLVSKEKVDQNIFLLITETAKNIITSIWFVILISILAFLLLIYIIYSVFINKKKKRKISKYDDFLN